MKRLAQLFTHPKLLALALAGYMYLANVRIAQADISNPVVGNLGTNEENQATAGVSFVQYFISLWSAVIMVGGIAVLVAFIWGSIDWISSAGDTGKLEKARNKMIHAALGLTILVASYTIVSFISFLFFGEEFNVLKLTIPDPAELL